MRSGVRSLPVVSGVGCRRCRGWRRRRVLVWLSRRCGAHGVVVCRLASYTGGWMCTSTCIAECFRCVPGRGRPGVVLSLTSNSSSLSPRRSMLGWPVGHGCSQSAARTFTLWCGVCVRRGSTCVLMLSGWRFATTRTCAATFLLWVNLMLRCVWRTLSVSSF